MCIGGRGSFRFAEQLKHVIDVLDVLLAGLFSGVACAQVIVALGEPKAALIDERDLLARVLQVLLFAVAKKCVYVNQLIVGQQIGQFALVFESGDTIKFRLQGFEASGLYGFGIHTGGVVIADLLLVECARWIVCLNLFEQRVNRIFGVLEDEGTGSITGHVGWNGIDLGKLAAGVFGEVDAGIRGGVQEASIEACRQGWVLFCVRVRFDLGAGRGGEYGENPISCKSSSNCQQTLVHRDGFVGVAVRHCLE